MSSVLTTIDDNIPVESSDVIKYKKQMLQQKMFEWDKWLTENPHLDHSIDLTSKARRQEIKILKLEIARLYDIQQKYESALNDTLLMQSSPERLSTRRYPRHNTPVARNSGLRVTSKKQGIYDSA